ncbi:MAG: DUF1653 domain-containing protein [Nanoarchaeota archaeon]
MVEKGRYRHYKGGLYQVLGKGRNSETLEEYVVYQPLYDNEFGDDLWCRPLKMFFEDVLWQGERQPRFVRVD